MIAYNPEKGREVASCDAARACVLGIGGAGANVIDRIALENMVEVELVSLNTDIRALTNAVAARKVQLGREITRGLGAGGDAELGLQAAKDAEPEIRELLTGKEIVFLCAGLGGGTGSGAAPLVAGLAREMGAFVVAFATMPFSFEGRRRVEQAKQALADLERSSDMLVVFENDAMGKLVVSKAGVQEAFAAADHLVGQSIRAVTALALQPGFIRIGMDDLKAVLGNTNARCLFGHGLAQGKNRAQEALKRAMKSPLLDGGKAIDRSGSVLAHVMGGPSMTLYEVELLMAELVKCTGSDIRILFGVGADKKLGEHMSVTVISSIASAGQVFLKEEAGAKVVLEQEAARDDAVDCVRAEESSACLGESDDPEPGSFTEDEMEDEDSAPEQPLLVPGEEGNTGEQFEMDLLCDQSLQGAADETDRGIEPLVDVSSDAQSVERADEELRQEPSESMDGDDPTGAEEQAGVLMQLLPKVFGRSKRKRKEVAREPGESGDMDESAASAEDGESEYQRQSPLAATEQIAGEENGENYPVIAALEDVSSEQEIEVSAEATRPVMATVSQQQNKGPDAEGDSVGCNEEMPGPGRLAESGLQGALALDEGKAGRFVKGEPTIVDGEDLDVPTFLRRKSVR
jgi:cell division protein FtsZ